jgi:hypothetical protein
MTTLRLESSSVTGCTSSRSSVSTLRSRDFVQSAPAGGTLLVFLGLGLGKCRLSPVRRGSDNN